MSVTDFTCLAQDETAMAALAMRLTPHIENGGVVALKGELGAGKTTFARALIRCLCSPDEEVLSPTFMLMQRYETRSGKMLSHYDLYRLKSVAEIQETGLEEAIRHDICLIEWPEIAEGRLPPDTLTITLTHQEAEGRSVHFSADHSRWSGLPAAFSYEKVAT